MLEKISLKSSKKIKNYLLSPFISTDYSHIERPKSRLDLIQISAAVMGIECCYAAETAFVSPILLNLGLSHTHMTLIWCLSPLLGFFLTPLLGVLSDNCTLKLGRRRPFVLIYTIGIILGLILVPYGRDLGIALGDSPQNNKVQKISDANCSFTYNELNITNSINSTDVKHEVPWGIFFTVMGTVVLDFVTDACQFPARAYLLDVTLPDDHARGLSTFTIMAGLGGAVGFVLGEINWNDSLATAMLHNHVRIVFTVVLVIYVICLLITLCSFREKPLNVNSDESSSKIVSVGTYMTFKNEEIEEFDLFFKKSSTMRSSISAPILMEISEVKNSDIVETDEKMMIENDVPTNTVHSIRQYFYSIVFMPSSLKIVCLTNLFGCMSLVCYTLYFSDFVGEAIFQGNPRAPVGSPSLSAYENGVRFACWGMVIYSLACSIYSIFIDKLIMKIGAKSVYVGGQLIYSFGMIILAIFPHPTAAIILSCTAGIMYSTLFTMPYLLVSHYHTHNLIITKNSNKYPKHGLGTDLAVVFSMIFVAQFILSLCIGSIVNYFGSTVMVVCTSAFLSFCGAITATQVFYSTL